MRSNLALLTLIAGSALNACATQTAAVGESSPSASQAADPAIGELNEHHRHHHHGGVTQFVSMALETLGLDDAAKRPQLDQVQRDLRACMLPARDVERDLLRVLADGVAAATVDAPRADATIARLNVAALAVNDCSADALNHLHAILSPTERAALVDKVQAHWDVWRQVNHEDGGRLTDLADELALTPTQVEQLSGALHAAMSGFGERFDAKKAEAHVQAFSAAFADDSFDARTVLGNANGLLATHGSARMALFYETVTPLLTQEQRGVLAEHLREHASHSPAVSFN